MHKTIIDLKEYRRSLATEATAPNVKSVFEFEDLQNLYDEEVKHNPKAYENLPVFLEKAEELYVQEKQKDGFKGDMGQSWRSWSGQNFEKLMVHILSKLIDEAGIPLELIQGSILKNIQTDETLSRVKRNVVIDYGIQGFHVPETDIVVYDPSNASVKAIISCNATIRERMIKSIFWKFKLRSCPITRHIKEFFITLDEDGTLVSDGPNPLKAFALNNLDVAYVLCEDLVEQHNIRRLERITDDLQ